MSNESFNPRRQVIPIEGSEKKEEPTGSELREDNKGINLKKLKRAGLVGALAGASLLSPQGAEAKQLDIAKAQTAVTMAELEFKRAKPEKMLEAEKKLTEAQGRYNEAVAKDADEREKEEKRNPRKMTDTSKIGVASENKAETTVTNREVDIMDENGKVIGKAMEGSKEWKKLEETKIKANRAIEKEKAKANRPIVVVDGYGYNRSRGWGGRRSRRGGW